MATFGALIKTNKFDQALELFKTLMNNEGTPRHAWTYSKALGAAIKLNKYSLVMEILRHLQDHDVKIPASDYTKILTSCMEAKEWALALSMLSAMQNQGMQPSSSTLNLLVTGCGKDTFWNMVIEMYNGTPEDLRQLLDEKALGAVLLAHSQAESEEFQLRTVEICNVHKKTGESFPYQVAMFAVLEANQYSEVISLAADAASQGLEVTPLMCRSVVMAHIRSGSMDEARQLLEENARRMSNVSVECYRELIHHYAEVCSDRLEACKLCVLMMQNNADVNVDDWRSALELALQLPDRAIYWELRKWLRLHGGVPLNELREHLLLPEDNHQLDSAASLQ
ncbi:hypothetical protein PHYPSEUDO_008669 [Phytophthora pseudosyringae]|uniref:Pentatricopeptide repeat-containing protein-mitochondrial domain-containing protein n=1 Tax=Phytophthora pseudosyringae TaxID=221518 RepID=A0A8T1VDK8_9STRA|nr:hypothetical protein PHYPSEUDO_008669 [Phytophthora pseudosyringae]